MIANSSWYSLGMLPGATTDQLSIPLMALGPIGTCEVRHDNWVRRCDFTSG